MTDDRLTRPAKVAGTISAFATRAIERGDAVSALVALGIMESHAVDILDDVEMKRAKAQALGDALRAERECC